MFDRVAAWIALAIVALPSLANDHSVTIGILNLHGEQDVSSRWQPTAAYLQRQIPGYRFVARALGHDGIDRALERRELDFVLTSPGQYVELADRNGVQALATLRRNEAGESSTVFGAVIFTRAGRTDITTLHDLKGRTFMADSRPDCCFYVVWREFKAHDIDPFTDLSRLSFDDSKEENIVDAVVRGQVDGGAVRTGLLEHLAAQGRVRLDDLHVVESLYDKGFPLLHSTRLYPEWPFAKAAHTANALAMRVQAALLALRPDDPAARTGHYTAWVAPLDYRPVDQLFQDIGIGPYASHHHPTWARILRFYWQWLLAGALLFLTMTGVTAYVLYTNRRLSTSKRLIEAEIAERRRAEEALRRSEGLLRALHDITTAKEPDFESRVCALLKVGCAQLELPVGLLSHVVGDRYVVVAAVTPDNSIQRGQVFELGQTYCVETLRTDVPVGFEHAAASEWRTHPAYKFCRLEAYLGIRLTVGGETYGTLNFMSPDPRAVHFTDTDRKIIQLMAQWVENVLERREATAVMQKLSAALEGTADAVVITDHEGRIEFVNSAFERITGYSRDEALGRKPSFLQSGQHDQAFYRDLWQTLLQGRVFRALFINRRKDDSLYYEEKAITPLSDTSGAITHFIAIGHDVTERRSEEERLRKRQAELAHSARVSAMGEMPSALAHELSQPLAAISNYAQGCLRRLSAGATDARDLKEAIEYIDLHARQSGEIVGHLRRFLRKGEPRRRMADINQIVREAAELADVEARWRGVRLVLELASDLPPVSVDAIQIEQVVVNLVHNAVDAIDAAASTERWVKVQTVRGPDDKVDIIVRDSGPGLPSQVLDHLFDAFFTTKQDGMGLGLSISRSIVEAHEGTLQAQPGDTGGAIFRFSLSPSNPHRETNP